MKSKMVAMIVFVVFATVAMAQPPVVDPPAAKTKAKPPAPTNPDTGSDNDQTPKASGNVFVIVCDAKPGQMIVLDGDGKWVPSVKGIEIKFDVGQSPTLTCTIYEGQFKPSRPQMKSWTISQMKTVSNAEFQRMVDSLQTDPEAIKSMLKE